MPRKSQKKSQIHPKSPKITKKYPQNDIKSPQNHRKGRKGREKGRQKGRKKGRKSPPHIFTPSSSSCSPKSPPRPSKLSQIPFLSFPARGIRGPSRVGKQTPHPSQAWPSLGSSQEFAARMEPDTFTFLELSKTLILRKICRLSSPPGSLSALQQNFPKKKKRLEVWERGVCPSFLRRHFH